MIDPGIIWRVIVKEQRNSVAAHAGMGIELQPLPDDLFIVLTHGHVLASEHRPPNLNDHRAFWHDAPENRFVTCNIIDAALERYSRRPLNQEGRVFLDHWRHCAAYLASQGHQGIEDDRDHWRGTVTGDWSGS